MSASLSACKALRLAGPRLLIAVVSDEPSADNATVAIEPIHEFRRRRRAEHRGVELIEKM
jgi:hypothetical protein